MNEPFTMMQLRDRRSHELKGCAVSASQLIDNRCATCKEFDRRLHLKTNEGWKPTTYDKALMTRLRIRQT